jgi:GNAT superfamily N-acetyltransferase
MPAFAAPDFPKTISLRDGAEVLVRQLEPADAAGLHDFFASLPAADRHYMKHDVLDPATTARWAGRTSDKGALSLVAVARGVIVADATLLRLPGAARRHRAEVRINITPGFQARGLGTILIRELAEIAWEADVEVLEFELVEGVQDAAIEAVQGIGAYQVATLPGGLRDAGGESRTLAYYQIPLGSWFKF